MAFPATLPGMAPKTPKKRKPGRPQAGEQARDQRVTFLLTAEEKERFEREAQELGVPTYLYGRWLLTRHPIPGEK